jgi:hypothetical protein
MKETNGIFHDLNALPHGAICRSVTAKSVSKLGRKAQCVSLDAKAKSGQPNIDFIDMPTFLILPVELRDGEISVDVLGTLTPDAPDYARAFAGLAYHISETCDAFEAVYLRPLNGLKLDPPGPRAQRAVQYFAYPDWRYEHLREQYPDGRFECAADIGPNEWITLKLTLAGRHVDVDVNGERVLSLDDPKVEPALGRIGLFVDIGTEAYFSNLRATPKDR